MYNKKYNKFFLLVTVILLFYSVGGSVNKFNNITNRTIIPTSPDIIIQDLKYKSSNKQHPRLMATKEDFNRIRKSLKNDTYLEQWYQQLTVEADKLLVDPLIKYEKSGTIRFSPSSDNFLNKIITLSLMYQLSGNERYADKAWEELEIVSNEAYFHDWNPSHFIDTASIATAVAIGYDWLYEYLQPNQKKTLQNAIVNKAFDPALKVYTNRVNGENITTFWNTSNNNWNVVSNAGLIISALAIADETDELEKESGEILEHALNSVKNSLETYKDDVGAIEGPNYWHYETMYIAYFLSSLNTAIGTDYGLSISKGLSETGYYPIYITGTSGIFNVGDSNEENFSSLPQLFWFSNKYKKPEIALPALSKFSPMNIVWYRSSNSLPSTKNTLPLNRLFMDKNIGIATMRDSWSDPNTMFLAVHAGANNANHGDLDIGTFVLDALGERWINDLGRDNYNLPGYFKVNSRWDYYRKRAEGHNTLVINPSKDPDQEINAVGDITMTNIDSNIENVSINMTAAYKNSKSIQREFLFTPKKDKITLEDTIMLNDFSEIYWFVHTTADIVLSNDKKTATLNKNGKSFYIKVTSPLDAHFLIWDAKPLSSSPNPTIQSNTGGYKKLALNIKNTKNTSIAVVFSTKPF
ncbi:heparinase II/III family protein [Niallia taxi]|nr:heparinase II/III family protein [Niallia taxi]MDE5053946.1 heparinase II/III family protein [Niallia taxi]